MDFGCPIMRMGMSLTLPSLDDVLNMIRQGLSKLDEWMGKAENILEKNVVRIKWLSPWRIILLGMFAIGVLFLIAQFEAFNFSSHIYDMYIPILFGLIVLLLIATIYG